MKKMDAIEPFRVMQLLEAAKKLEAKGRPVVHMEIGEPDYPPSDAVFEAAKKQLDLRNTFYTPSTGLPDLQQRLAAWYQAEHHVEINPDRILITPGTSGAFAVIYHVLLEHADTVLLPDPGYPCQRNFVRLAGGEPINVPVGPDSFYHLSGDMIAENWQTNTRACVVTSPGNPTGTIIPEAQFKSAIETCETQGGHFISDEIYHGLCYGKPAQCALSYSDQAIVVNGFSKRWAMTGWRVGWMIVPETLIDPCRRVIQNIFIAAPTISQYAAIHALEDENFVQDKRHVLDQRRRFLLKALPSMGFDVVVEPEGAFYIYANVEKLTQDSTKFCWDLLEKAFVAITPGEDFGTHKSNTHVRFSYATSMENIEHGLQAIRQYLD